MSYKVNVNNIDKVTVAHIHQGKPEENGPPVVWLFNSSSNPTGPMNGKLSEGKVTSNDLVGPLKGKQISDLVKIINDGNAYANVHTQANPKREITTYNGCICYNIMDGNCKSGMQYPG
ncbi:MAG TPA: CHRD domain-containing protein [Nitrososphaeraceae archaeon]|nr:CHRD domain-containing protein [Nitrososphaeraceae archaeon]